MSNDKSDLSELGRRLSAARKTVHTTCGYCGKEIEGIGKRKWCSDAHRVAFGRKAMKANQEKGGRAD